MFNRGNTWAMASTRGFISDVVRKMSQPVSSTRNFCPSREFRGEVKSGTYPVLRAAAQTIMYRKSFALISVLDGVTRVNDSGIPHIANCLTAVLRDANVILNPPSQIVDSLREIPIRNVLPAFIDTGS